MEEFNNRINMQREVLEIVNDRRNQKEELCGLSRKAIERWISVNRFDTNEGIPKLLFTISEKLFFLANKSQEQISEKYALASLEISRLCCELKKLNKTR